jgi:Holliday junction resolvase RusA-like endonuclease
MIVQFAIPDPPSLNNIYANRPGGGRFKTAAYKKWRKDGAACLGWIVRANTVQTPVDVTVHLAKRLRGDADNRIKPTLDLLVAAGVLPGDQKKFVRSAKAEWTDRDVSSVTIRTIEDAA